MTTLTTDDLQAVRNVVDYLWAKEQIDYEAQDDDGRTFHIFNDLGHLDNLLNNVGVV